MSCVSAGVVSESGASIRHLVRTVACYGLHLDEGPSAGEPVFHARVSSQHAHRLWERAVRELGPEVPLLVAQKRPDDHVSPLYFAAMSCATLGDALQIMVKHWRYVTEAFPVTVIRRSGALRLGFETSGPKSLGARLEAEYLLADLVRSGCDLSGGGWRPTELVLANRPPIALDVWESACGVPVRVDPESPGLVMAEDSLEQVVQSRLSPAAGRFFLDVLDWLTPRSSITLTLGERVAATLAHDLGTTAPSIEQVAQSVALSKRSLHRQLAAEGTSYQRLLDGLRRDEALRQALDAERQFKAIAAAVGFSDQRGFRRAFKRWTGVTPQQFRRRQRV